MTSNIIAGLSLALSLSLGVFYLIDREQNKFLLENNYSNSIQSWHYDVILVLKKLDIQGRDRTSDIYKNDLAELSALIDQGRFFFPNIKQTEFGIEKPFAYRGYRNLALDFLVALYNLYSSPETTDSELEAEILQKHFTSIVFEIVNPRERLIKIKKLTDRYFLKDETFQHFLKEKDGQVIDHIWRK